MLAAAGAADGAQTSAKAIGPYLRITKLTETQHRIRQFGATVAASGDGQTVVVGSPFDTGAKGAAYVFSKRGAVWSSTRLSSGGGRFGSSVSISFDGRTVLIGAPAAGDDEFGAAWVFKNPGGGVWTGTKLKPYGADGDPGIGYSVALSGNGLMAVAGGPFDNRSAIRRPYTRKFGKGGAWLFRRSGATWRQFGNKLTGAVGKDGGFGASVDLDFDGSYAIVGAPKAAAAFIFDRKAWDNRKGTPRSTKLSVIRKSEGYGWAVSIEGGYAAVGEALQAFAGSIHVYKHSSTGSWRSVFGTLQGHGHAHFGAAVSLAAPPGGQPVLLVGAYSSSKNLGGAWLFGPASDNPDEVTWAEKQELATGVRPGTQLLFGAGVALSGDGQTAVVGASGASGGRGEATVYATAPTIDSIDPASGPEGGGTVVRLKGSRFNGVTGVTFGTHFATSFHVDSSTSMTAVSPPAVPGTVGVSVALRRGTASAPSLDAQFTYLSRPIVDSLDPNAGPTTGGTSVTIGGSYFRDVTAVRFGSVPAASYKVLSQTVIQAVSPPGAAGTVDVTVTAATGTSAGADAGRFTYFVPASVVTFDNLTTGGPSGGGGAPVVVNSQYAARGLTFNDLSAIDYSKGAAAIPGFTHSVPVGVESCVGVEFCTKPIRATFAAPQRSVCAWVGFSFRLDEPVRVQLQALSNGAVIGVAGTTLPARTSPTPIRTPLLVTAPTASITELEIFVPGGYDNALAADDITFSAERALSSCS